MLAHAVMEPAAFNRQGWWLQIKKDTKEQMDAWCVDDPMPVESGGLPRVNTKVYKAQMELDGTLE